MKTVNRLNKEMKTWSFMLLCVLSLGLTACSDDKDEEVKLCQLTVQLSGIDPFEGAVVELRNSAGSGAAAYTATTNTQGLVVFEVPSGIYEATTTGTLIQGDSYYVYNGVRSEIVATAGQAQTVSLDVTYTRMRSTDQILIKEVYNGGVMTDDGSKAFYYDKYIVLYNNCPQASSLDNLCIGIAASYNAEAATVDKLYDNNGELVYKADNFIPAQNGIWYFPATLTIEPYSQVVVNIHGAIDNTQTVSKSVNFANADYYCMYDPTYEGGGSSASNNFYNNTSYYPAPADVIPTSHYLKTVKVGQGNAWPISNTSPAIFIFQTKDTTPTAYGENADNLWYVPGYAQSNVWACVKVKNDWILDGVEVFNAAKLDACKKRLTADIDAGHVNLTNQLGHSLYRNVNKEATEALPENEGKLVYSYALGVDASTDPSGIDAEASIKNGAHIVYQDTNNSTADFHERQRCSLK